MPESWGTQHTQHRKPEAGQMNASPSQGGRRGKGRGATLPRRPCPEKLSEEVPPVYHNCISRHPSPLSPNEHAARRRQRSSSGNQYPGQFMPNRQRYELWIHQPTRVLPCACFFPLSCESASSLSKFFTQRYFYT